MRLGRAILAGLVAVSVAMLPIAGAFAVSGDEPVISDDVMASGQAPCQHESMASETSVASAHDCCHHDSIPTNDVMKDCYGSAGCTAKCFSVVALVFSNVAIPLPTGGTQSHFVTNPFHSQTASPPYRPPRV
jgi:hypothetical protein